MQAPTASRSFPTYLEMRPRISVRAWHAVRVVSLLAAFGLCGLLLIEPDAGLDVFWGFFIPLLPLVFFLAPGLWRNVCPLAASNQIPRVFGFTRGLTLPDILRRHSYLMALALLLVLVPARKPLFNDSGVAAAALILGALAVAFVGGLLFKGKSGWCSSFCPLLPVQRIYGQTPFATVRNSHCEPCVGCTKNCYDFNPSVANLADLYDEEPHHRDHRALGPALFPGLVLAFYVVETPPVLSTAEMYAQFGAFLLASAGSFFVLNAVARGATYRLTVLYGAVALLLYYAFNFPRVADRLFGSSLEWLAWPAWSAVLGLTVVWVVRSFQKEPRFVVEARPVAVAGRADLAARPAEPAAAGANGTPEVVILPEDWRSSVIAGSTLLEAAEASGLPIEAGCRLGFCGSDPVAVLEGTNRLTPPGPQERKTLERLGLAENTRMACSARVHGRVCISLTPHEATSPAFGELAGFQFDASVERIVVLGNGIAGITAADHARRRHPDCEIHVVGRETHHLYNRMAISRLIYGRSAMEGLYLLPETWYEQRGITCWLNTRAARVDRAEQRVDLATGDVLGYDRLILALGSSSFVPPLAGFGTPGSFVLREAADAMEIRAFAQEHGARRAVVGGGGLLGLEAGYALHKLGLEVTVLERSSRLLRRQLDERAARLLRSYIEGLGMQVLLEAEATRVEGRSRVESVALTDGRLVGCDVFLVCAGIEPNVALARDAGLEVNRGVIVDDHLRTSDARILAAGDVAEHRGRTYGLWPSAVEQGEVAAVNAVGGDAVYEGSVPVTILKVTGIDLMSVGRFERASRAELVIALEERAEHRYRKLVLDETGRVAGAILLGYPLEAPGILAAIDDERDVRPWLGALLGGDWSVLHELGPEGSGVAPSPALTTA